MKKLRVTARYCIISMLVLGLLYLSSCQQGRSASGVSTATGWEYNNPENGGFEYRTGRGQVAGPGLRFIKGGTFIMGGGATQDVMYDWNNVARRVTVASFYIDETEVRNIDWREYLHWLRRVYPESREKYEAALPDTLVWREELSYNDPYVREYFRHPAYSNYPIVGVSWRQANDFCDWRTDRVNEMILIKNNILEHDLSQTGQNVFTTETYLNGFYNGIDGKNPMKDLSGEAETRRVNSSDGILLPRYRLPTEAEWEYAALGISGEEEELLMEHKIYPWRGSELRLNRGMITREWHGRLLANFMNGRGDYAGVPGGSMGDGYEITSPVASFPPNDYGLYDMAGNVNEWVYDSYRPSSSMEMLDLQPFRGNVYTNYRVDSVEGGGLIVDEYGEMVKDTVANYINYLDGDHMSRVIEGGDQWDTEENMSLGTNAMYQGGGRFGPRITDYSRVYKGGSWKDRPYWLASATRRYLDERRSTNDIGFRCAMTHVEGEK